MPTCGRCGKRGWLLYLSNGVCTDCRWSMALNGKIFVTNGLADRLGGLGDRQRISLINGLVSDIKKRLIPDAAERIDEAQTVLTLDDQWEHMGFYSDGTPAGRLSIEINLQDRQGQVLLRQSFAGAPPPSKIYRFSGQQPGTGGFGAIPSQEVLDCLERIFKKYRGGGTMYVVDSLKTRLERHLLEKDIAVLWNTQVAGSELILQIIGVDPGNQLQRWLLLACPAVLKIEGRFGPDSPNPQSFQYTDRAYWGLAGGTPRQMLTRCAQRIAGKIARDLIFWLKTDTGKGCGKTVARRTGVAVTILNAEEVRGGSEMSSLEDFAHTGPRKAPSRSEPTASISTAIGERPSQTPSPKTEQTAHASSRVADGEVIVGRPETSESQGAEIWVDERDGRTYRIARIGSRIVMAENLAYKPKSGRYCAYNDDDGNVARFGYLYELATAKEAAAPGWHLPTAKEWGSLFVDAVRDLPYDEKVERIPILVTLFNPLFGGWRFRDGTFHGLGAGAHFWVETDKCSDYASTCYFDKQQDRYKKGEILSGPDVRSYACSVRLFGDT